MKIALFLGAGASVPLGKLTTKELKKELTRGSYAIQEEIFQSFLNNPEFQDIEYVLQSIREIVNFAKTEGGNYFFKQGREEIFKYERATVSFSSFTENVEEIAETLEDKIFEYYRWNHNSDKALLNIYDKIFNYLLINSEGPIQIFSTNYDKAIEQFCHLNDEKYICIDGFENISPHSQYIKWTGKFEPIVLGNKKSVFLYKLHGSLNWKKHTREDLVRTNEESKSDDGNFTENMVIYPTLTPKEEEDTEPHKTIIKKFKEQMEKIDVCIVIGYSFRDSLNETFKKFVSRKGILIAISPDVVTDYRKNVLKIEPIGDQIKEWKQMTESNGELSSVIRGEDTVYLIQRKLETETIEDIVTNLDYIIHPGKYEPV